MRANLQTHTHNNNNNTERETHTHRCTQPHSPTIRSDAATALPGLQRISDEESTLHACFCLLPFPEGVWEEQAPVGLLAGTPTPVLGFLQAIS